MLSLHVLYGQYQQLLQSRNQPFLLEYEFGNCPQWPTIITQPVILFIEGGKNGFFYVGCKVLNGFWV